MRLVYKRVAVHSKTNFLEVSGHSTSGKPLLTLQTQSPTPIHSATLWNYFRTHQAKHNTHDFRILRVSTFPETLEVPQESLQKQTQTLYDIFPQSVLLLASKPRASDSPSSSTVTELVSPHSLSDSSTQSSTDSLNSSNDQPSLSSSFSTPSFSSSEVSMLQISCNDQSLSLAQSPSLAQSLPSNLNTAPLNVSSSTGCLSQLKSCWDWFCCRNTTVEVIPKSNLEADQSRISDDVEVGIIDKRTISTPSKVLCMGLFLIKNEQCIALHRTRVSAFSIPRGGTHSKETYIPEKWVSFYLSETQNQSVVQMLFVKPGSFSYQRTHSKSVLGTVAHQIDHWLNPLDSDKKSWVLNRIEDHLWGKANAYCTRFSTVSTHH